MTRRILLLLLLTLILGACNELNVKRRAGVLEESIDKYNVALRWAFYQEVESYHMARDGTRTKIDLDALKDIRITGYSVTEKTLNEELTEATVRGTIDYYNTGQGTLKKAEFNHKWWYEPERKRWFIESPFPEFR